MKVNSKELEKLKVNLKKLASKEVAVGIFGDAPIHKSKNGNNDINMVKLGAIHEFGATIGVTDKMRSYLHATGLHLKKSTQTITIPQRSFLRETLNVKKDEIATAQKMLFEGVLSGKLSADASLNQLGLYVVGLVQERIANSIEPKNHPYTIGRKGSSTTLIDTGHLRGSIRHEVRDSK